MLKYYSKPRALRKLDNGKRLGVWLSKPLLRNNNDKNSEIDNSAFIIFIIILIVLFIGCEIYYK